MDPPLSHHFWMCDRVITCAYWKTSNIRIYHHHVRICLLPQLDACCDFKYILAPKINNKQLMFRSFVAKKIIIKPACITCTTRFADGSIICSIHDRINRGCTRHKDLYIFFKCTFLKSGSSNLIPESCCLKYIWSTYHWRRGTTKNY